MSVLLVLFVLTGTVENNGQWFRQRLKSWTKSKQKFQEFSSLLFTVTSTVYNFAMRFLFLQTHATSYVKLSTVKEKGGKRKLDRKPYPLPMV
jgi:hypothetical protein